MEKVRTTLKQIVRDWSDEGAVERNACYQPVIDEILRRFPRHEWLVVVGFANMIEWFYFAVISSVIHKIRSKIYYGWQLC